MSDHTWRTLATICHFLVLFVHVVGGLFLTSFSAHLFGGGFDILHLLDWTQLSPSYLLYLLAIWLPLPIGMIWARRLIGAERYEWSSLVSLLTPLASLLLVLGVMFVVAL